MIDYRYLPHVYDNNVGESLALMFSVELACSRFVESIRILTDSKYAVQLFSKRWNPEVKLPVAITTTLRINNALSLSTTQVEVNQVGRGHHHQQFADRVSKLRLPTEHVRWYGQSLPQVLRSLHDTR